MHVADGWDSSHSKPVPWLGQFPVFRDVFP